MAGTSATASASTASKTGPFQPWSTLTNGWKIFYGVGGIGILIALATTRFAPLIVLFLVTAIVWQLERVK